ncbi:MAG: 4-(cytidine 5'-diphospho)-2-C-methyl-D-erythritol kinase [Desulfovibrio sp.]
MKKSDSIRLIAQAKINLSLAITGLTDNGYHTLDTVFYPLSAPHDILDIQEVYEKQGIEICCDQADLATQDNLIAKAWKKYGATTGFSPALHVTLKKNIPSGAGLGGGSSDAAVMLNYLNKKNPNPIDDRQLNTLAASLGADIPFFLKGVPARATGIGEVLTPVDIDFSGYSIVLVCPDVHVSTVWAYKAWDKMHLDANGKFHQENSENFLTRPNQSYNKPTRYAPLKIFNDFEEPVFKEHSELRILKERLLCSGACAAAMSGSGSSIFGLYRSQTQAQQAAQLLGQELTTFYHHF